MKNKTNFGTILGLLWASLVYADDAVFTPASGEVYIPAVSIQQQRIFTDVILLLENDGRLRIKDYQPVNSSRHPAEKMPLLAAGSHLGMIVGFNAEHPEATRQSIDKHWREALEHGMRVGRVQIDWAELEPQAGVYDTEALEEPLKAMKADGLQPFVLISTIDSEEFTLPADLNTDDTLKLDSPVIIERFKNLLNWAAPMIVEYGGWAISVGNEPGNYLADHPEAEQSIVNFLKAAREHSHSVAEKLALTMTLAYGNVESGYDFYQSILENSDFACFNYYAADQHIFFQTNGTTVADELDFMLKAAGDKFLVMQELGAAAGYQSQDSLMQASPFGQQYFFDQVFAKLARHSRFKAAFVFQLVDWDPALVNTFYTQPFIEAGLDQGFIDRFAESLETTGLIQYQDGISRPAWDTFLDWLERLK